MVRALDVATGEEQLLDPGTDSSLLGQAAAAALARDASGTVRIANREWFLTVYNVPPELVIIGAVHIAQALAQLALAIGYRVRVIDPRPAYAHAERFDGMRLVTEWPDEALAAEPLSERSALVALAHDPKIDDPALRAALASPAFYVGALGSKRTHARRRTRLAKDGVADDGIARIHGPVGLAIGARSPSEIAIAILAEMIQLRHRAAHAPRIAGIVLAAGLSRRMGFNKLTAEIKGRPLVRHAVEAASAAGLAPILVVTGHEKDAVEAALSGLDVRFVHNAHYAQGLSTSLKRGVAALPACDGAMILLGDMPDITPKLIGALIAAFEPQRGISICAAASGGRRGHPVLWGQAHFSELLQVTGDQGARDVMAAHPDRLRQVAAETDAPLRDIDTPDDLKKAL